MIYIDTDDQATASAYAGSSAPQWSDTSLTGELPEGGHFRWVRACDVVLFGFGRVGVQCLRFVPPAFLRDDLRLRGEPFAALVALGSRT